MDMYRPTLYSVLSAQACTLRPSFKSFYPVHSPALGGSHRPAGLPLAGNARQRRSYLLVSRASTPALLRNAGSTNSCDCGSRGGAASGNGGLDTGELTPRTAGTDLPPGSWTLNGYYVTLLPRKDGYSRLVCRTIHSWPHPRGLRGVKRTTRCP